MRKVLDPLRALLWWPLVGRAETLPPALLARHPELGGARWRRGGLPPRIGGWCLGTSSVAAITLWRTVFLAPGTRLEPRLLLHEFRHVEQFGASAKFPFEYVWESLRRGYHANRFEVDAESYALARLRAPAEPFTEDA